MVRGNFLRWLIAIAPGLLMIATVHACTSSEDGRAPAAGAFGYAVGEEIATKAHLRTAEGNMGLVTVNVTTYQAALPDPGTAPAETTLVARFQNQGDENKTGNKKEKRYKWKPVTDADAYYDLVLADDGTPKRTQWIMWEYRTGHARASHGTGYLAVCDPKDHAAGNTVAVDFKVCTTNVQYNPGETAVAVPSGTARFASYAMSAASNGKDAPAWISCTSGCCSLGGQTQPATATRTGDVTSLILAALGEEKSRR